MPACAAQSDFSCHVSETHPLPSSQGSQAAPPCWPVNVYVYVYGNGDGDGNGNVYVNVNGNGDADGRHSGQQRGEATGYRRLTACDVQPIMR